jgi:cardiolipin synthase
MISQELIGSLTLILHLALAARVTLHVLLTKRDVAASVSWIGIAWLSPVVGSALYWLIGINRVKRRAVRLRRRSAIKAPSADGSAELSDVARHLESLEIAGWRITGRRAEPGNRLDVLELGDEAYPRMLAAIAAARRSVALSTYIFRAGIAGEQFVAALAAAQARGVAVRVLVDGFGGGYFYSWSYRQLRKRGVPVARFLHSEWPWRMPFLNMRLHSKLLMIDGVVGFTGGLNIGDENLLSTRPTYPVRDTHFEVGGPVVAQLVEAFATDWLFTTGETLAGPAWIVEPPAAGEAVARVITSGPDQPLEKLEFVFLSALASALRTISIVTPYFLPDERLVSALAQAAMRGVKVDIVVPGRSNHRVVDWATQAHLRPLLLAGCRIWHQPPPFDHSKLMTIDGVWCLIGSANWDMRSLRLNFELGLEVYDATFAARIEAMVERKQGHRLTVRELDARPYLVVLRDAAFRLLLPYL